MAMVLCSCVFTDHVSLFCVCFAVVECSSIYTVVGFTLSETRALSAPEKGAGPMALMLWLEWVT
jgi:hypothetical protein